MKNIAIIGGGASGTLLAINLLRQPSPAPLKITLFEKRQKLACGVAFSTENERHLLNVPASKMSAFPDDPNNFVSWLNKNGHSFEPNDFVPRRLFGEYLKYLLDNELASAPSSRSLDIIAGKVDSFIAKEGKYNMPLSDGSVLRFDDVVLAFGNFLPPHPTVPDLTFTTSPKYIRDIWNSESGKNIERTDDVLIVGTGLSMADVVLRLEGDGHQGKITAISTKGILPAVHKLGFHYESFADELLGAKRITDIFKTVRRHIRNAEKIGSDWRAVIDSLRPITQELWYGLPATEKRYFMQHLSRYWNAVRHRMPAKVAVTIQQLIQSGKLTILSGRLRHISLDESGHFLVNFTTGGKQSYVSADVLINCIASESNFALIDSELVRVLLRDGLIRCDPLNMGLDATLDGKLIGANGSPSDGLWTLGTSLKGTLWESTAIPEIRVQARALAERLATS
ncbi:FAD/NAD(P)-binding protein [Leptolyngbya sp. 7M]|uniref:FAD/NAD(P)-binding protein n=1 Tax=Leptolyngbya sp. 7M TaxID=2812896 RepID=UPI001B8C2072|nr:FAD/NAD(P)-binding protein [Leptolyngbya sp. 7M]QYO67435.1 FAD/NAD(P)-binding protein [Leptolyngbya sp. 7M]